MKAPTKERAPVSRQRPGSIRAPAHPVARETGDQERSAFGAILEWFLGRVPGARAAALVDFEGETVDYAGHVDSYAVRIAAAHFRILLTELQMRPTLGIARSLILRTSRQSYHVHGVTEGYALLVIFTRGAGFGGWERALTVCTNRLSAEAGWGANKPEWFPVDVVADRRFRPLRVKSGPTERSLEILGALAAVPRHRERAWRVRIESGVEAMLVREPGGSWYADEDIIPPPRPSR